MSRRSVLKKGAAAVGGAAAVLGGGAPLAQQAQAPAVLRGAQTGRRFRAALGGIQNLTFEELRLLPIQDRHVVVRTEATAPCYTLVVNGIGGTPSVDPAVVAEGQHDAVTVARESFVDGVVDDLGDQVVQAALACRADVHAWPLADGLEALEHGDGRRVVVTVEVGGKVG